MKNLTYFTMGVLFSSALTLGYINSNKVLVENLERHNVHIYHASMSGSYLTINDEAPIEIEGTRKATIIKAANLIALKSTGLFIPTSCDEFGCMFSEMNIDGTGKAQYFIDYKDTL